jgi:hypothetical protein
MNSLTPDALFVSSQLSDSDQSVTIGIDFLLRAFSRWVVKG